MSKKTEALLEDVERKMYSIMREIDLKNEDDVEAVEAMIERIQLLLPLP